MKKPETREKLLDTTLDLISAKGYLGTTTREIAQKAGVTELTLFRHFGSKEQLFEEVLKKYTFLPRLKELLPDLEYIPYESALRTLGIRFLETLIERKSMVRIMLSEINVYPDKTKEVHSRFISEMRQTLAGYFRSLRKRNILRPVSPEIAARAFLGMIFSYFMAEAIIRNRSIVKKEREKIIGEFVDMFVHGTMKSTGE
jgi:AcrR family transcriptional regulator